MAKITRNISFAQFGDLMQEKWENGKIGNDVHDFIEAGLLPIKLLRDKYKMTLERKGEGLLCTEEDDTIDEGFRMAA